MFPTTVDMRTCDVCERLTADTVCCDKKTSPDPVWELCLTCERRINKSSLAHFFIDCTCTTCYGDHSWKTCWDSPRRRFIYK